MRDSGSNTIYPVASTTRYRNTDGTGGGRQGLTVALRSLKCLRKLLGPLPPGNGDYLMTNYKLPDAGEQRNG